MSAAPLPEYEPLPEPAETPKSRDWWVPPPAGFTAEDLDHIPQLPAHTELVDGSLVFVSPQSRFHWLMIHYLVNRLQELAPPKLSVEREMTVTLGRRQRPEPDIMIVRTEGVVDDDQTTFQPEHVVLVIEVVSRDSEIRDRERKPELYAKAGIPHLWRVEKQPAGPVIYVYELDPTTHTYALGGIHRDRLILKVPFDIDIDMLGYKQR